MPYDFSRFWPRECLLLFQPQQINRNTQANERHDDRNNRSELPVHRTGRLAGVYTPDLGGKKKFDEKLELGGTHIAPGSAGGTEDCGR